MTIPAIEEGGDRLQVSGPEAVDGTPVVGLKPVPGDVGER